MCSDINSASGLVYIWTPTPPPLEQSGSIDLQHLDTKSEADRRQIFQKWTVPFIDNHLAAADFCHTDWKDVVSCVFYGVQVGS